MTTQTDKRWIVTSTWGEHHVLAPDEGTAEKRAEDQLAFEGYADPANMINDGLTREHNPEVDDQWEGDAP